MTKMTAEKKYFLKYLSFLIVSFGMLSALLFLNGGHMMNLENFKTYCPLIIFISLSIFCWFISISYGASYNLYFNNVEQGNNSQASPTLNVPSEKPSQLKPSLNEEKLEIVTGYSPPQQSQKNLRLGLLAQMLGTRSGIKSPALGGTLSAAFFPIRELGVNIFGNLSERSTSVLGAELEIIPLSLSLLN